MGGYLPCLNLRLSYGFGFEVSMNGAAHEASPPSLRLRSGQALTFPHKGEGTYFLLQYASSLAFQIVGGAEG